MKVSWKVCKEKLSWGAFARWLCRRKVERPVVDMSVCLSVCLFQLHGRWLAVCR